LHTASGRSTSRRAPTTTPRPPNPPNPRPAGTLEDLEAEAERVAGQITKLEGVAKAEAATAVSPNDKGGAVLAGLKKLRQQRLRALRDEAERLKGRIAEERGGGGGGKKAGGGKKGGEAKEGGEGGKDEL
jgi:hypothetical protein